MHFPYTLCCRFDISKSLEPVSHVHIRDCRSYTMKIEKTKNHTESTRGLCPYECTQNSILSLHLPSHWMRESRSGRLQQEKINWFAFTPIRTNHCTDGISANLPLVGTQTCENQKLGNHLEFPCAPRASSQRSHPGRRLLAVDDINRPRARPCPPVPRLSVRSGFLMVGNGSDNQLHGSAL